MKKFASALLAVTALTANVFAAGAADSKTGAYLGGNVGMANTNVKYSMVTGNWNGSAVAPASANNFKADTGKMNPLFGLFAGYGMQVGSMYFGGEVYGGFDSAKLSPYDDSASGSAAGFWKVTVKRANFYGIAPRVGVFITPSTMLYAKLAIEGGKWKTTINPNLATINDSGNGSSAVSKANSSVTTNASKNSISFAPGLGLDAFITKNLFLRAEYSYLFGPKMTVKQDIGGYSNVLVPGNLATHKIQITQQTFKVGVGYKF